jgi:hypothetical protein
MSYWRRWSEVARSCFRGWDEGDIAALQERMNDPTAYNGGILKLSERQFRALQERNRRIGQRKRAATASPLLVWIERRGLISAIRKD